MNAEVVLLPRDVNTAHLAARAAVIFDVLRATTTMAAALAAGVREIRVFGDLASATRAAESFGPARLLCGEENCRKPLGFDLGNSPGAFDPSKHRERVAFMSTTNGTRAILAARGAKATFVGALVNAGAVAGAVTSTGLDVTLLCAGTNGQFAMEDVLGAGAVLEALVAGNNATPTGDPALAAHRLFRAERTHLAAALAQTTGGRNVIAVGLQEDIAFASRLNALKTVGVVEGDEPIVRLWSGSGA